MNKLISGTGIIVLAALLLSINLFSDMLFKSSRLDLTENKLYTLSPGTKHILSSLDEPITLRFYFSEKSFTGIPGIMNYGQRVRDLLEDYVSLSHGKLKLIVADPEPFSVKEDQAVQYGLQGVPVDTGGSQAYFGLVGTNSTDKQEVIPFLQPSKEESLEYDITRMIYQLSTSTKSVVGVLTTLPMEGDASSPFGPQGDDQGWYILKELKDSFTVKMLKPTVDKIPDDINVLMLVHPKKLSDKTLYAIDQYVMKGGRLFAFVDPFSEADKPQANPSNPMAAMQQPRSSDLHKLFAAWGIDYNKDKVVGDRLNAQRVQAQMGTRVEPIDYVVWLSLSKPQLNTSDFITRDLKKVDVATAGFLEKKKGSKIDFTPLIQTSDEAAIFSSMQFQFGANPAALLNNYHSGGKVLTLAARISGKLKSAFPDGIDSADKDKGLKESKNTVNMVVVADTDLLQDRHWVTMQNFFGNQIALPRASNDAFVLNTIENLSGSNDLISLRSRGRSSRPFEKVKALKQAAEKRFRDKEKALQVKLQQAEQKLSQLQRQGNGGNSLILTPEQKQELATFQEQRIKTRKELRAVQHELIENVDNLGTEVKVINIVVVPLLVIIVAIFVAVIRARRLKSTMG